MYRISEIKLRTDEDKSIIPKKIEKKLGKSLHGAKISAWNIVKESLDARDKQNIRWIYTVDFDTEPHIKLDLKEGGEPEYMCPQAGTEELKNRPVICGFGPAGMFCALILAEQGYRPTVIERGQTGLRKSRRCGAVLERRHTQYRIQCAVRRGRRGNFFRRQAYDGHKRYKDQKSAAGICERRSQG